MHTQMCTAWKVDESAVAHNPRANRKRSHPYAVSLLYTDAQHGYSVQSLKHMNKSQRACLASTAESKPTVDAHCTHFGSVELLRVVL